MKMLMVLLGAKAAENRGNSSSARGFTSPQTRYPSYEVPEIYEGSVCILLHVYQLIPPYLEDIYQLTRPANTQEQSSKMGTLIPALSLSHLFPVSLLRRGNESWPLAEDDCMK